MGRNGRPRPPGPEVSACRRMHHCYADGVHSAFVIRRALLTAAAVLAVAAGCSSRSSTPSAGVARGAFPEALVAPTAGYSSSPWRWTSVSGLELRSEHWVIRSSLRNAAFMASLPAFYEAALRNYRTGLVPLPTPGAPLESCVFGNREEWARYTEHRLGSEAAPYLRMGRGGFTTGGEAVLYDIGPRDTLAIAAHEGWHQYTQTTFRHSLPVWLEEGIACYMEGFRQPVGAPEPTFLPWRNPERYAELRSTARKGRLRPIREVLEGTPQSFLAVSRDAQLSYYAQVWALVHFLRDGEGGRHRAGLERMLADAVDGRVGERIRASDALDSRGKRLASTAKTGIWLVTVYLDTDFDRFAEAYDAFVRALVDANAWDRVMRGQSPLSTEAQ